MHLSDPWTKDANGNQTNFAYNTSTPSTGQIVSVTGPPPTTGANAPQARLSYTSLFAYYKQATGGSPVQGPSSIQTLTGVSNCATGVSPGPPNCVGTSDEVKSSFAYGSASLTGKIDNGSGGSGTVLNVSAVASGRILTGRGRRP